MPWDSVHVVLNIDGFLHQLTEVKISPVIGQLEPLWEWMDYKGRAERFKWSGEVDGLRQVLEVLWRRRWCTLSYNASVTKLSCSRKAQLGMLSGSKDSGKLETYVVFFHDLVSVLSLSSSSPLLWRINFVLKLRFLGLKCWSCWFHVEYLK